MMRVLCVLSKYDYGFRERGLCYEYIRFYDVIRRMGHDARLFDFVSLLKTYGRKRMNEMLLDTINTFEPDIMFAYLIKDEIDIETLSAITHDASTTTMAYFGDDEWRFDGYSSRYAKAFKWVVTTDRQAVEKYRRIGCRNIIYKKDGVNYFVFKKKGLPVVFNCTFVGAARLDRVRLFNQLRKDGVEVRCWGTAWDMTILDRIVNKLLGGPKKLVIKSSRTRLTFEEMSDVFEKSKINLNLSGSYRGDRKQIKGRIFDVTASGGFLLSEFVEGIGEFFEIGEEIVCFETYDELLDKIRYYLSHESERRSIAEAGYKRTISDHTAERRLNEIFTEIGL